MANSKELVKYELEDKQEKKVVVPRSASEIQRFKLEKLLKKSVSSYVFYVAYSPGQLTSHPLN